MVTLAQQRAQSANTQAGALANTGQQFMQFLLALMQQQEAKADRAQDRAMQQLQMQSLMQAMRQRSESGPTEQLLRELQLLSGRTELEQSKEMQPARQRLLEAQATEAETRSAMAPEELALKRSQLELAYQKLAQDRDMAPLERQLKKAALDLQAQQLGMETELLPFRKASIQADSELAAARLEAQLRENRAAERLLGPRTDAELARINSELSLMPLQEDVARAQGEAELLRLEGQPERQATTDATGRQQLRTAKASADIAEANAATAEQRSKLELEATQLGIDKAKLDNALSELEVALGDETSEMLREQLNAVKLGNVRSLLENEVFITEYLSGTLEQRKQTTDALSAIQLELGEISAEEARRRLAVLDRTIEAELAYKEAQAAALTADAAGRPDPKVTAELTRREQDLQARQLELQESIFERGAGTVVSDANRALLGAEGQAITLASGAQGTLGTAFSEPENDAMMAIKGLPGLGVQTPDKLQTPYHRGYDPNDPDDAIAARNETVLRYVNDYLNASDSLKENVQLNYDATMGDSGVLNVEKMLDESQYGGMQALLRAGQLSLGSPAMLEALASVRMGMAFSDDLHPVLNELVNSQEVSRYIDRMPADKKAQLFSKRMEDLSYQARALETAVPDQKLREQYFKILNNRGVSRSFKDVLQVSLIDAVNDPEQANRLNTLLKDWTPNNFGMGASISSHGRSAHYGPEYTPMAQPRGIVKGQPSDFLRGTIGDEVYATDTAKGHGFFGGNDVTLDGTRYGNANEAIAAGYLLDQLSRVENPGTPRERFPSRQAQYGGDFRYRLGGEDYEEMYQQSRRDNPELPVEELYANYPPPGEYLPVNPMLPVPVGMQAPAPAPGFGTTMTGYSPQPFDDQMAMLQAMYNQPPPAPAMPAPQQLPMQMMPVPGAPVGAIPMMAPVDPMEQLRMILNPYSSPVP